MKRFLQYVYLILFLILIYNMFIYDYNLSLKYCNNLDIHPNISFSIKSCNFVLDLTILLFIIQLIILGYILFKIRKYYKERLTWIKC